MSTKAEIEARLELSESKVVALEKTIEDYRETTTELETKLKNKTQESDRWYESRTEFSDQLEQLHIVFDALSIPRKKKPDDDSSWSSEVTLTLSARWIYYFHMREQSVLGRNTLGTPVDRY